MSWLDALVFGLRGVFQDGAAEVDQAALNVEAPITRTEDVGNGYITLAVTDVTSTTRGTVPIVSGTDKVCIALANAATWAKLVNANVDTAAAIAGTKIAPSFGAQVVSAAVGGQLVAPLGATITDANNQTLALAGGQLRAFTTPTGLRDHDLSTTGAVAGSWITFIRPVAGAFAIVLRRSGFAGADIVQLPASTWSSATVFFDGAVWKLLRHTAAVPGADSGP